MPCPKCGSHNLGSKGLRRNLSGTVRRAVCRDCGQEHPAPVDGTIDRDGGGRDLAGFTEQGNEAVLRCPQAFYKHGGLQL